MRNKIALFLVWPGFIPHFLSVSDTYAKSAPSPVKLITHEKDMCHIQGVSPDPVWASGTWWYFCISQNDIRTSLGMSAQCNTITFQRCHWNKLLHGPTGLCSKSSTHTCTHTHTHTNKCAVINVFSPSHVLHDLILFFSLHTRCKVTCKYRCAGSDHDDV